MLGNENEKRYFVTDIWYILCYKLSFSKFTSVWEREDTDCASGSTISPYNTLTWMIYSLQSDLVVSAGIKKSSLWVKSCSKTRLLIPAEVTRSHCKDYTLFISKLYFWSLQVKLVECQTSPPGYLTESELITLMEKHGIGTDASIPVHINNICLRNYVTVESGRKLVPTPLGILLVHGYHKVRILKYLFY